MAFPLSNALVYSSCALSVLGVGHLQILCCPEAGHLPTLGPFPSFNIHAVSYQNITTQGILLRKKADWLICQGQEKIKGGCKGMFLILCMHFVVAYQARITYSEIGSYRRETTFFGY